MLRILSIFMILGSLLFSPNKTLAEVTVATVEHDDFPYNYILSYKIFKLEKYLSLHNCESSGTQYNDACKVPQDSKVIAALVCRDNYRSSSRPVYVPLSHLKEGLGKAHEWRVKNLSAKIKFSKSLPPPLNDYRVTFYGSENGASWLYLFGCPVTNPRKFLFSIEAHYEAAVREAEEINIDEIFN